MPLQISICIEFIQRHRTVVSLPVHDFRVSVTIQILKIHSTHSTLIFTTVAQSRQHHTNTRPKSKSHVKVTVIHEYVICPSQAYSANKIVTDGRTDRQTTRYCRISALKLHSIAR